MKNGYLKVGIILTFFIGFFVILGLFYTPYDTEAMSLEARNLAPDFKHLMGTDNYGRDIFSRVLVGLKTTVIVALTSVLVASIIGLIIGAVSGYIGGYLDDLIMRSCDIITAFPSVLTAMILIALLGRGQKTVIIALIIAFIPSFTRLMRGEYIRIRNMDYIKAARLVGIKKPRIMTKHIFPNARKTLLVGISVGFNNAVLAEATMSFLGIGVQPPTPSVGGMLSDSQGYFSVAPWYAIGPGLVIVIMVLGLAFISEGLNAENK